MSSSTPKKVGRPRPALFRALGKQDPPSVVEIEGHPHHLVEVLKHDSWAATATYQGSRGLIVCKFHRQQRIGLLPMRWFGRWMARHEAEFYHRLDGNRHLPELIPEVKVNGEIQRHVLAHTFVPGRPLKCREKVADHFFPELEELLQAMHKEGMAYVDLHKPENIIVGEDDSPYLIDFQISYYSSRNWWAKWSPMRIWLHYLQKSDVYHLRKHYARCRPDQCGYDSEQIAKHRPWWIRLHRMLFVPVRTARRRLLVLLGIRRGKGRVTSEHFAEDAVRRAA